MKRLLILILWASPLFAQSGILAPTRYEQWARANVGVPGGIPTTYTKCGSTITAGTSLATINTTISGCGANTYVLFGAGTFNLAGSVQVLGQSNVILRGSGPTQTTFNFTADGAGGSFSGSVYVAPTTALNSDSAATQPGQANAASWTAGYTQGATSITVTNVGATGILNGDVIILDQKNDLNDNSGYMVCDNGNSTLSPEGGVTFACMASTVVGGNTGRVISGVPYAQQQMVVVTAGCASACIGAGPFTLTISPGLYANNWNGTSAVGIWFVKPIKNVGIENLTVDDTNCPNDIGCNSGIQLFDCYGCWVKNVTVLNTRRNHVMLTNGVRDEVRESYFYGTKNAASQSYGVETFTAHDSLIENNIFQQITTGVMSGGGAGNVIGYNFQIDALVNPSTFLQGQYPSHSNGDYMNLWEGNVMNAVLTDQLHGTSGLITIFRNWINGLDWNTNGGALANHPVSQIQPVDWASYTRGMNVIGNVLGTPGTHTNYELATPTGSSCSSPSIFVLGYANICGSAAGVADDTVVKTSLMRWGNYDTANAAVRWDNTESSPGAITWVGANTTPASHTLPASFYLAAKPTFFNTPQGSLAYPPVGPDVVSGQGGFFASGTYSGGVCPVGFASGGATCATAVGGFANINPAMNCYYNVLNGVPDGSGNPLAFDANFCYVIGTIFLGVSCSGCQVH